MRRHRFLFALGFSLHFAGVEFVQAQLQDRLADPLRIEDVLSYAQRHRREIAAARAQAEISTMESMYSPMALVRSNAIDAKGA